ncbi:acyl-CoA-binding domain-containing protein 6-like [Lycorma delicatula]|uniref:acyl-CoA-binding domain-containing protein 6-like n=1 Tax=Lycorma delicatula TaxID=130591 RepID=UPI003F51AA16
MAEAELVDQAELENREDEVAEDDEFGIEEDELTESFNAACEHVKKIVRLLTPSQMLEFYALFKQATVGPCSTPRPSWYAIEAKQKWDAWNKLGTMSKTDAMDAYIRTLQRFDLEVSKTVGYSKAIRKSWISVSSMTNGDVRVDDEDKTVYDWVKEGNLDRVRQCIRGRDVSTKDSEGMGLIHWAADRGNLDIIRFLVCDMNADIEMRDADGQTAVHYAASCGHQDVLRFLIDAGADTSVEDNDGLLPKNIAADSDIENMLP